MVAKIAAWVFFDRSPHTPATIGCHLRSLAISLRAPLQHAIPIQTEAGEIDTEDEFPRLVSEQQDNAQQPMGRADSCAVSQSMWYFERCWRYERPQRGRYREFFQLGVEVINPSRSQVRDEPLTLAERMVAAVTPGYEVNGSVSRGLAYYTAEGFESSVPDLGAQKQVVGGGAYKQGIGFAVGFDRLMPCQNR